MLDQLMQLVQQQGQKTIVENPKVPNEKNEAVMQEASGSVFSGLQDILRTGGPVALKNLFQGAETQDTSNPQVQQIENHFAGNLSQKLGFDANTAKSIAISIIPMVLNQLTNKTKDPNNSSFNIQDMLGSLTGSGSTSNTGGGMMSNLSSIGAKLGLDKDKDGDVDMQDLMGMFGGKK